MSTRPKKSEIKGLSDDVVLTRMKKAKTGYSGFLSDVIRQNAGGKKPEQLIIRAAHDAFMAIKGWLSL